MVERKELDNSLKEAISHRCYSKDKAEDILRMADDIKKQELRKKVNRRQTMWALELGDYWQFDTKKWRAKVL